MLLNERPAQYWRVRGNYGSCVEHKEKVRVRGNYGSCFVFGREACSRGLFITAHGW
jgi:hypothetical protein